MTALKAKIYYGRGITGTLQLSSTSATHVYLNPQTIETETLKEMYEKLDMHNCEITTTTDLEVPISHLLQGNSGIIELRVGPGLSNVNKESVTLISHMHNQRWTLWRIWKLSTIQGQLIRLNLLLFLKG
ncbi:hypothetical protein HanPI659440_Chr09g0329951 [Helianthus annuus]|nr:hypothetical protein HanPI659440_Chr09g0329951 [Helianthus annuus]